VTSPNGEEWLSENAPSMRAALHALDQEIERDGGRLLCAGLHNDFYESGLSAGTGYVYISGYPRTYHMMERTRLILIDEAEAVAGAKTNAVKKVLALLREQIPY
jgi:hypothetical protein